MEVPVNRIQRELNEVSHQIHLCELTEQNTAEKAPLEGELADIYPTSIEFFLHPLIVFQIRGHNGERQAITFHGLQDDVRWIKLESQPFGANPQILFRPLLPITLLSLW